MDGIDTGAAETEGQADRERTTPPRIRPGWLRTLLLLLIAFAAAETAAVILVVPLLGLAGIDAAGLESVEFMLLGEVAVVGILALAVGGFCRYVDRRSLVSLGLSWHAPFWRHGLYGILWGGGIVTAVFVALWLLGALRIVSVSFRGEALLLHLALFALVAFGEELVVRGYVLRNLMDSMSPMKALAVSAVPFALGHASNPNASVAGVAIIALAGLLLGVYYVHRRNLWFPIGLHLAWNCFQGAVYGSRVSGLEMEGILGIEMTGPPIVTGGDFGFEASVVTGAALLAATVLLHGIYRRAPGVVPPGPAASPGA